MDTFKVLENVHVFTALDDGEVEKCEGFIAEVYGNRMVVRASAQEYMTFMHSAPDDMWLRVVPDGGSVACTRLEKIVPAMKDNTKKPVEPPKRDNSVWKFLKKK